MRAGIYIIFVIFILAFFYGCQEEAQRVGPPNVVIIFTDDQGYQDVGCFGSPDIATPHLDQLARDGVRLTDFSVAQPVCSASRAALLTGCYPNRIGLHGALMPKVDRGLHHNEVTMAEMLKDQGYATGIFGKWHLGNMGPFSPLKHGFDEFVGIPYSNDMWPLHPWQGSIFDFPPLPLYHNDDVIDSLTDQSNLTVDLTVHAVDFINRNKENPFFLYVPHPQPHVPLFVSDAFRGKSKRGLYGDVIMEIDWSVGEIIKALDSHGISDNTIVIFTSDNGPWLSYGGHGGSALPYREGKGTAWEGGVREPFIIKYPALLEGGATIAEHIMSIDILPTIARLTGGTLPSHKIDGLDVWDIITGASDSNPHRAYYYYYYTNQLHAVRKGDWKLYFPHRYTSLNGREGTDDGMPISYDYNQVDTLELYNVTRDPAESDNVIDDHPMITKLLRELADIGRLDLGDELMDQEGSGRREPGTF